MEREALRWQQEGGRRLGEHLTERPAPPGGVLDTAYSSFMTGARRDLLAAIQAHASNGSEANAVVQAFNQLNVPQKQSILDFLRSLYRTGPAPALAFASVGPRSDRPLPGSKLPHPRALAPAADLRDARQERDAAALGLSADGERGPGGMSGQ